MKRAKEKLQMATDKKSNPETTSGQSSQTVQFDAARDFLGLNTAAEMVSTECKYTIPRARRIVIATLLAHNRGAPDFQAMGIENWHWGNEKDRCENQFQDFASPRDAFWNSAHAFDQDGEELETSGRYANWKEGVFLNRFRGTPGDMVNRHFYHFVGEDRNLIWIEQRVTDAGMLFRDIQSIIAQKSAHGRWLKRLERSEAKLMGHRVARQEIWAAIVRAVAQNPELFHEYAGASDIGTWVRTMVVDVYGVGAIDDAEIARIMKAITNVMNYPPN